jgi:CDP-diacylglycerol---glycerol-3-phosphate 3-phosphatidyltransferase
VSGARLVSLAGIADPAPSGGLYGATDCASSLVLVLVALGAAIAYAARASRSGPVRFGRVDRAGGSALLGKGLMQAGYFALRPIGRACVAAGVGANAVSWSSLAFGAAAGVALAVGHYGVGAFLGALSSLCDALDGMIAREAGSASDSGEVLDAAVDRYAELFFLGGIAFHERDRALTVGLALGAIAGAVMVSYSTAKAEALHVVPPRSAMRRQERSVYLVLGTALSPIVGAVGHRLGLAPWVGGVPLLAALALVAVVGNASAVRRLHAVARAVRNPEGARARARTRRGTGGARGREESETETNAREPRAPASDVCR